MLQDNRQILLIDDNDIDNLVFSKYFEETGLKIHIELNGQSAINYLNECLKSNEAPLLIVVDIHMPLLNGFEFLAVYESKFKPIFLSTKVVILTSSVNTIDRERADNFNFIDKFFIKPFNKETKRQFEGVLDLTMS